MVILYKFGSILLCERKHYFQEQTSCILKDFFSLVQIQIPKIKLQHDLYPDSILGPSSIFLDLHSALALGYSRKKKTRGLRTWNFQGYWRKSMWKFQELIKKEVEFLGVYKKENWCGISMGLGIWPWNIQGVSHNFAEFPGMKACFLQNF